jgi:SAM-dependent methyltransferase
MCKAPREQFRVLGIRLNQSQGRNPRRVTGAGTTIVRCQACGLVFPDPQPIPARIEDHYDMPGEAYWGDARAIPEVQPAALAHWKKLRTLIAGEVAPCALDVGVGSGFTAQAMIAGGFDVHGFEPIPQFRELALKALALPAERIAAGGIEDAAYPPGTFDLINFGAVLEHLYDPSGSLKKALGWLKCGGLIVLEVPSSDWLVAKLVNAFFRLRGTGYVTNCSPMHSPFHLYEFTPEAFRRNGERMGYAIAAADYDVGRETVLPGPLQRLLNPAMRLTDTGLTLNLVLRKD